MNAATKAPKQAPATELQLPFAATAPAAEAWLQRLPTLGFGDACRHLFNALRAVNRLDMAAHQRFQLLETLRTQVLNYSRRFEPYFVEQSFPLDDKVAKVVRLATQFQAELALGYHRVAESPACAEVFSKAQQATATHRALTAYGLYLLRSAQSYEAPTASVWPKIYGVYRRAETLGVADEQVTDLYCPLASSASECLRKIALFQLALPTRLQQKQIGELYGWFDDNSHLVRLQRERAFNLQEAHFYLDLSASEMPQPIGTLVAPHAEIRYLFLEPMMLELLESGMACSPFGLSVARRLVPSKDSWQEDAQIHSALFATGTEGCAALLEADVPEVRLRLKGQERATLELFPTNMAARAPLSARVAQHMTASRAKLTHVSRDEIWGGTEPEAIAANHSSEGLVRYYADQDRAALIGDRQDLKMGQLVAVAAEGIEVLLGIVRTVTATSDATRVWADVEIIPGTVATARAYVEGERRRRLPALVVTGDHGQGATTSVMLLPTPFPNGTWITLEQQGKWSNQRLARLVEATGDFCQYHMVPAE